MSDTPRTDEQHKQFPMGGFTLDFARQLERELVAKTEAFDRLNESLPKTKRLFTNALAETIIDNQLKLIKQLENDLILTKKGNQ
jgi:hypothetical protein